MENTKPFYDYCIPYTKDRLKLIKILRESFDLGYRTVAIEQIYDHTKKDATKKASDIFPPPIEFDYLKEFDNKLKILQRLTIIYTDPAISHAMTNSLNIKKYSLVAGLPKNDNALTHCCSTFSGDIIAFDPESSTPLVSRKTYQVAANRGMYFEIKYVPAIINSSARKEIIKISHNYHAKGKSKNIIITSGATSEFQLRGPYDIAALGLIFGLSEEQAKNSISNACRILFLRAESRRIGKTIMFIHQQKGPVAVPSDSETEEESDEGSGKEEEEKIDQQQPFKKKRLN